MLEGRPIDTDLRKKAVSLQKALDWEDAGPEKAALFGAGETGKCITDKRVYYLEVETRVFHLTGGSGTSHLDDEYRWAGVEDPKIMLTTSHDPSSRLKMFVKVSYCFYHAYISSFTIFHCSSNYRNYAWCSLMHKG